MKKEIVEQDERMNSLPSPLFQSGNNFQRQCICDLQTPFFKEPGTFLS